MADVDSPAEPDSEPLDAYALLSKPTLEISDAQAEIIIEDLRRRRKAYLASGKPDKPKAAKVAAAKLSADEKAANTASILAQLVIPGVTGPKS
jgi:hypothetical protein